jgi:hypothetical protein
MQALRNVDIRMQALRDELRANLEYYDGELRRETDSLDIWRAAYRYLDVPALNSRPDIASFIGHVSADEHPGLHRKLQIRLLAPVADLALPSALALRARGIPADVADAVIEQTLRHLCRFECDRLNRAIRHAAALNWIFLPV